MLRIVVADAGAEPGAAGEDRTARVARALRDAGHEVIYTGLLLGPEQVVETAIQEDADLVACSGASATHTDLFRGLLSQRDADDIAVLGSPVMDADPAEIVAWVASRFPEGR